MHTLSRFRVLGFLLVILPLTGCLFRSRRVERQISTAPLKSATQAELIDYINSQPPKNRFVIGRNDIESHNPEQPMENLRPQQIYDSLILREVDPANEIAVMQNSFEIVTDAKHHQVQQADYEIEVIRKGERGWYLSRK